MILMRKLMIARDTLRYKSKIVIYFFPMIFDSHRRLSFTLINGGNYTVEKSLEYNVILHIIIIKPT